MARNELSKAGGTASVGGDCAPLVLTVPEVARAFHISEHAVWNMIYRRELPIVRFGRSVRVARRDVEAIAQRGTLCGPEEEP